MKKNIQLVGGGVGLHMIFLFICCFSVIHLCLTLCYLMDCSMGSLCFTISEVRSKLMSIENYAIQRLILSLPSLLVLSLSQHSLTSKEQACFKFVSAVTDHRNFGAQENTSLTCFNFFPIYLP